MKKLIIALMGVLPLSAFGSGKFFVSPAHYTKFSDTGTSFGVDVNEDLLGFLFYNGTLEFGWKPYTSESNFKRWVSFDNQVGFNLYEYTIAAGYKFLDTTVDTSEHILYGKFSLKLW